MLYIGIDFSLNSPSVCFLKEDGTSFFYNIFNLPTKISKKGLEKLNRLKTIQNLDIEIVNSNNNLVMNYDKKEHFNLENAIELTNKIIDKINTFKGELSLDNVFTVIEGFSYGSLSNRLAELIGSQYILRKGLLDAGYKFMVLSPKTIKKFAGNGNFDKVHLVESFLGDEENKDVEFIDFLKNNRGDYIFKNKIEKPVDDLIDSYWAAKGAKFFSKEGTGRF